MVRESCFRCDCYHCCVALPAAKQVNTELGLLWKEHTGHASDSEEIWGGGGSGKWWMPWHATTATLTRCTRAATGEGGEARQDSHRSDLEAPLLQQHQPPPPPAEEAVCTSGSTVEGGTVRSLVRQRQPHQNALPRDLRRAPRAFRAEGSSGGGSGSSGSRGGDDGDDFLFWPLAVWAQPQWGVMDWGRYYLVSGAARGGLTRGMKD